MAGTSSSPPPQQDAAPLSQTSLQPRPSAAAQAVEQSLNSDSEGSDTFDIGENEASRLKHLTTTVRDQDDIEKDVGRQADQMLLDQADERDNKRLEKAFVQKHKLDIQVKRLQQRVRANPALPSSLRAQSEIQNLQEQIATLDRDLEQIQQRIEDRHKDVDDAEGMAAVEQGGNQRRPGESRRDFLIRTGKITPFSRMGQSLQKPSSSLAEVMLDAEEHSQDEDENEDDDAFIEARGVAEPLSHRNLMAPGFAEDDDSQAESALDEIDVRPRKRQRVKHRGDRRHGPRTGQPYFSDEVSGDDFVPTDDNDRSAVASDDTLDDESTVSDRDGENESSRFTKRRRRQGNVTRITEDLSSVDDGDERFYQSRLSKWVSSRRNARRKAIQRAHGQESANVTDGVGSSQDKQETSHDLSEANNEDEAEWYMPHPTRPDSELDGGFRIPGDIFPSLFDYQKTGVRWLWELYSQQVGGIVGDEMGLGKTIQVISFLAGLHHSKMYKKPIIVVTPATVMKQWVNEFHRWWPPLRVSILHTSGSGMLDISRESRIDDELDLGRMPGTTPKRGGNNKAAKRILDRVLKEGHVLVTTYSGLQSYADLLIPVEWGYAVLDEGHKIRNPNTSITIFCKELRTPNRVILSGTPMQNNLTELWSLFDFIFPMRLGTLVNFRNQFEIPIKQGGYANASNLQVETALTCAQTLKDTISPYLLQRWKSDVAADLPTKSEQVLFCKLTKSQRDAYENFINSDDLKAIMAGRRQSLYGIDILRKICNHPDLQDHKLLSIKPGYNYGSAGKSGKMQVVKALLQLWKETGHKTLLFTQHRIMLDILEKYVRSMEGMNWRRMDGNTAIKDRQNMVDEFNNDPDLHVFLLTTKVGGLGVNLTGADRVIIFDPDWNPSTDVQARERAWRLGQKREVMIYRLMTAGTIEEKIYHRQLFKQFLTNKILRDPKQRQTFHLQGLQDLFTLGEADSDQTETGGLFQGSETRIPAEIVSAAATSNVDAQPEKPKDETSISSIAGISHREAFKARDGDAQSVPSNPTTSPAQPTTSEGTNGENSTGATKVQDTAPHLMEALFSRSGVQSSLSHDAILSHSSNGKPTADPAIIAREAKRVAAAAAAQLQRSGEAARAVPIGTPTWTGVVGVAGRPESPPPSGRNNPTFRGGSAARGGRGGGGPASSAVLANLAARQQQQRMQTSSPAGSSRGGTPTHQPRGEEFLAMIRDYLQTHGGRVYTQMLIDHFNRFCTTPQRTAEFKEMLRTIAVLDRGSVGNGVRGGRLGRGGRAMWVLKRDFGGSADE